MEHFDVAFIDCMHWMPMVIHDIIKILNLTKGREITVIFDDYGLGWGPNTKNVKYTVDWFVENGYMKVIKRIGHKKGTQIQNSKDCVLCDSEGIICKTLNKNLDNLGDLHLKWAKRDGEKVLDVFKGFITSNRKFESAYGNWMLKKGYLKISDFNLTDTSDLGNEHLNMAGATVGMISQGVGDIFGGIGKMFERPEVNNDGLAGIFALEQQKEKGSNAPFYIAGVAIIGIVALMGIVIYKKKRK